MTIIVFDTETTGLLGPMALGVELQPHCVEFHGIKMDYSFDVIETLSFRCRPPIHIPDDAIRVHGITNEMVANEKPFAQYFVPLCKFFCGSEIGVGHNIRFDQMIIYYELVRLDMTLNYSWPMRSICTVEACVQQLGYRQSLADMHMRLFGCSFEGAHTASADCEMTKKCFVEMATRGLITL